MLTTADLLFIFDELARVQRDQLESLHEGSYDDDDYNLNAVREIRRTLLMIQNNLGDDAVDLWGEIAQAETILGGEA